MLAMDPATKETSLCVCVQGISDKALGKMSPVRGQLCVYPWTTEDDRRKP